ncbi:5832_t:CDS:1, partial [Rhizophagus irregularis]
EIQIHPGEYLIQNIHTNKYWAKPDLAFGIPLQTEGNVVWKIFAVGKNFYIRPLSHVQLSLALLVNDKLLRLRETTPNPQNLQWIIHPSGSNVAIQSAADSKKYVNTDVYNKIDYLSQGSDAEPMWRLVHYAPKRTKLL